MKTALLVPIHLDGLRLTADRHAITAHADFRRLPHVEQDKGAFFDANGDRPFLSSTALTQVFDDSGGWLQAGLHLHWELPEFVRTARHPVSAATGMPDRNRNELDAAPDRWLVCRWMSGFLSTAWIVESDFVWSPTHEIYKEDKDSAYVGGAPPTMWPHRIVEEGGCRRFETQPGDKPYRFVGRTRQIGRDWGTGPGSTLEDIGQRLTAAGYGDPGFAAFYPNCRSVFGLYDAAPGNGPTVWYEVFGWYRDLSQDPLALMTKALDPKGSPFDFVTRWEKRMGRKMRLRWNDSDVSGSDQLLALLKKQTPAITSAQVDSAFLNALPGTPELLARQAILEHFRLTMPDGPLPASTLCYGFVPAAGFVPPAPAAIGVAQVTVGNTGTEAAAAWAAQQVATQASIGKRLPIERTRVEDLIEAVNMARDTPNEKLDVGTTMIVGRHERAFRALPGSPVYVIRQRNADASAPAPALPSNVATLLDQLNLAQQEFDRGQRRVEALRFQLYADWARAMHHTYSASDSSNDYLSGRSGFDMDHDADALAGFLKGRALTELNLALAETGDFPSSYEEEELRVTSFTPVIPPSASSQNPVAISVKPREIRLSASGWRDATTQQPLRLAEPSLAESLALALKALRDTLRTHSGWVLSTAPGPRYFRPADPTLLIASPQALAGPRQLNEHFYDAKGLVRCQSVDVSVLENAFAALAAGSAQQDKALPAALSDHALRKTLRAFAAERKLGTDSGPRPVFLDWQVDVDLYRRGTSFDPATGSYAPNFVQANWVLGETAIEHTSKPNPTRLIAQAASIRGRSALAGHARSVLQKRLEDYIIRRLSQPVVLAPGTTRSTTLPSYLASAKVAAADAPAHLRSHFGAVQSWIVLMKQQRDYEAAAAAVELASRASGKDPVEMVGAQSVLNTAILTALNTILGATNPPPAQVLHDGVGLDDEAIRQLLQARGSTLTLQRLFAPSAQNPGRLSRLLRYVDAYGYIAKGTQPSRVYSHPVCAGLPQGGAVEHGILSVLDAPNTATLRERLTEAGVLPGVIAAICEYAAVQEIRSLQALLSIRPATPATLWKLLNYASTHGQLAAPDPHSDFESGEEASWQDEYGRDLADPLVATLDAWMCLESANSPLTATLSGFNDAFLMRRREWQLPVADPLGFPEYRNLMEGPILEAIGPKILYSPEPTGHLVSLRAGEVNFTALRVVDLFGQFQEIPLNQISACSGMQPEGESHISLQPRLTQPARLNLRWLAADSEQEQEWNTHPAKTPICGWLALDSDGGLLVFHADGQALGTIDLEGRWAPLPGHSAPVRPEDIANAHLRRMVVRLCQEGKTRGEEGGETWIERFGDLLESALENIDPHTAEPDALPALLMSRPLALVRTSLSVELRDPPATNLGYAAFSRELAGADRDTAGLEQVKMPVRIGEHMRLNDGVVGYWLDEDPTFYAPQSAWRTGPDLRVYREKDHALNHWRCLADAPMIATVLLDPRGLLHATCGLLPAKSISLPPDLYGAALRKMQVSILCAPVLGLPGEVELPLREEPRWSWTWTAPVDGRWEELPLRAIVSRADILRGWPKGGEAIWAALVSRHVLEPLPKHPDRAVFRAENLPQAFSEPPVVPVDRQPDLRRLLESAGRAVRPLPGGVDLQPRELREGWLRLAPSVSE